MGKENKQKEKLSGGWESVHAALWLIGLAIIAWQGWWWPGILVLVALSVLFEAVIKKIAPDAFVIVKKDEENKSFEFSPPNPDPSVKSTAQPVHRADLLPTNCPKCGAPTRSHEVIWTGAQSADCPFCGSNLPMKKA
ncbi:MAG: hypothetical protein GYA15_14125 [Leptolinea sp.]|nr:hypothetical protein [Leptolinea sp.]